jgi:hypothetical protein
MRNDTVFAKKNVSIPDSFEILVTEDDQDAPASPWTHGLILAQGSDVDRAASLGIHSSELNPESTEVEEAVEIAVVLVHTGVLARNKVLQLLHERTFLFILQARDGIGSRRNR